MPNWFIPLISAIGGGLITSLVAPLIKWDIEKRKIRRQSRIDKIKFWRGEIDCHEDFSKFFRTQTFNELRPLFTKEEQNSWDAIWHGVYLNKSTPDDRLKTLKFHSKVSELEKKWKII